MPSQRSAERWIALGLRTDVSYLKGVIPFQAGVENFAATRTAALPQESPGLGVDAGVTAKGGAFPTRLVNNSRAAGMPIAATPHVEAGGPPLLESNCRST